VADFHPLYLRGIEYFNRQAYFSAHEAWEDLWRNEEGEAKEFYKGLIQAAVALHHLGNGNLRGARNLYAGCRRHLEPFRPRRLGLDVDEFLAQMARSFEGLAEGTDEPPRRAPTAATPPKIELSDPG
jgi:predicted metal-dependent hydrolase